MKLIFVLILGSVIGCAGIGSAAEKTHPKYGPQATPMSLSHEYMRRNPAPDYWALSPYYTPQQNSSSCSIASVTMLVNAARAGKAMTSEEELATQTAVLKRSESDFWQKAVGTVMPTGVTLDQLAPLVERSLKAYGISNPKVEVVHVDNTGKTLQKKLHKDLVENEKSANDFIILNFDQRVYTGDTSVGHIAPLAAYDAKQKRALVFDPDRQWYEPYWVSEETLLAGMATKDPVAGKNRGYLRITVR